MTRAIGILDHPTPKTIPLLPAKPLVALRCVRPRWQACLGLWRRGTTPASSSSRATRPPSSSSSTPCTPAGLTQALPTPRLLSRCRRRGAGSVRAGRRALAQGLPIRRSTRVDPAGRHQPRPQPPALPEAAGGAAAHRIAAAATVPVPVVEVDDDLAAMVAALPQQQRLALSLFYFAALSVAEVAHSMELSEGAVKYHLHAARTSLARSLEARDDA